MPVYEVKSVIGEPRAWTSSHGGNFLSYKVDLECDGVKEMGIEWNKKDTSPAPSVGEQVAGIIEEGKYGDKFKIDYEATKELGGNGGSSETSTAAGGNSKGGWQPESERDPERAARILRQHSQSMAVQAAVGAGYFQGEITITKLQDDLLPLIDWFDADVLGQTAKQTQGSAAPAKEGAPPPASASPGSVSQPADEHQWFCKLLETAGLGFGSASKLATFILEKLSPEQIKKADNGLSDLDTMAKTLGQLESVFRQTTGEVLVDEDPDDSIPF